MKRKAFWKSLRRDRQLVFMLIPVVIFFAVFSYYPLYGILIAFKDYSISRGILGSPWAGLRYFRQFFSSPYFGRLLRNTVLISVYSLLWGFPIPILFALLLNEFKDGKFKRVIQTVSYLPHFISLVVICGILIDIFSPQGGVVNSLLYSLTGKRINFFGEPEWFRTMYVGSGVWQEFGWNSIIYLAAITGINPDLYEAADIDGATGVRQFFAVTLPLLSPTIFFVLQTRIIGALQVFDLPFMVMDKSNQALPSVQSVVYVFYQYAFTYNNRGYGATIVVCMLVIILAITFILQKTEKKWVFYN